MFFLSFFFLIAALLTVPPSFMISPTITLLFIWSHTIANALPEALVPNIDIQTELPLSLLDAMTRSMLVCDGVVSLIKNNPNPLLRTSPMALLITSIVRYHSEEENCIRSVDTFSSYSFLEMEVSSSSTSSACSHLQDGQLALLPN